MASQPLVRADFPDGDGEHALVARVREGDREAFAALVRRYYGSLCRFAYAYLHAREAAEDIVQDVFCAVWEQRARWVVRAGVRAYLYGAVRNRAYSARARDRLAASVASRMAEDCSVLGRIGGSNAGEASIRDAELQVIVRRVVENLPDRCREAFTLSRDHHLSLKEIAALMGTSPKTVEVQLSKALRALRIALAGELRQ